MLNKAVLIGNFGADPEIKYLPNGTAVATVSIATTRRWKDKQTNEAKTETEWHRVVFFGRQAEIVGEYLKKGSKVYVEGRLKTRKWQGQDGQDRYSTDIIASELHMLDCKRDGEDGGNKSQAYGQSSSRASGPEPSYDGPLPPDDFDYDIPF